MVYNKTELFDALYGGDLCAIVFSDIDGFVTRANDYCIRLMGYQEEDELVGKHFLNLVPDEDHEALDSVIGDLISGAKRSSNICHRFIRKDGRIIWITGSLTCITDAAGNRMFESAFIDNTSEKTTEQQLAESQELLKSAIDNSDVQLFTLFPQRHHLEIYLLNPRYKTLPTSWDDYPDSFIRYTEMPDEDASTFRSTVERVSSGAADEISCVSHLKFEGQWIWLELHFTGVRDADGAIVRVEGYAIDVTQRREAELRRDRTLEVMGGVANKYDAFYLCDLQADTFKRIDQNKRREDDTHLSETGKLSDTVAAFVKTNISPAYQEIFARFNSPDFIRTELADGKESLEFQYRESEALKSRWKLGEIIGVSQDDEGMTASYCFLITDITELKQREFERMRESETQAAIVNIAYEMTGIFDFTYHVAERAIDLPERTYKSLSCKPRYEDMPVEFRNLFIHPDYYDVFNEMYVRCNNGEEKSTSEFKDKLGKHWYRTTLYIIERDKEGNPLLALGIVERVDELHAARSEAATMQQLCQFAVESHYENLIFVDTHDDSYAFVDVGSGVPETWNGISTRGDFNDAIEQIMGTCIIHDEDRASLETLKLETLVPYLKQNGMYSFRYRATLQDETRWKLVECTFFNNEFDKVLLLISDVQQEEMDKASLREAREAADEANRAKSAFLANMSHEIRTPMNTIIGISEILLNKQLPIETLNEISTIQNAASGLLAIINDILDFSKIESGKFVINPVDYMLPSMLMDINNMISVRLVDKPVNFLINVDHNLPNHLIGDDIRIEQILMNLLGNAVKFTKEGFIELRIQGETLEDGSWHLVFKVIDSGIGIKQEDVDKLFGSFTQVDTTKNRAITGSGLGLAISRSFAEMMGGGIKVESTYGKGSTFTVDVIQQVKVYEPLGEVKSHTVKMLICENDEVIISSISRTLENLGVEFRVCREFDKVRSFEKMTHVIIRRNNFLAIRDKLDFMFDSSNVYLIVENGEQVSGDYMEYKQLQLPLLCLQVINALNGETIANSYKRKNFDRSQIIPLSFAHILIVDDNVTNLQVARGLMAPYQMQIDVATSGFKAIELAKSVKYDIIFMDHMMPEMDGLEATKYIRELPGEYYKTLPIVALTANAVSDARELFLSNGMDDFLAKPIEMTELHRILKQYVQSKAPVGYMEQYLKHANIHKDAPKAPAGAARQVAHLPQIAPLQIDAPSDGSALGQLIAQNNALLSQNMLLLQSLLGGGSAVASGDDDQAAESTLDFNAESPTMTENDAAGNDQVTQVLPASIPEVNMEKALEVFGGDIDVYHGILATYFHDISEREPQLRRFFADHDTENLTISVHAIKSASREVGADALGELAFQLEKAGKADDWAFIEEGFERFCDELDTMRINVGDYVHTHIETEEAQGAREKRATFPPETIASLKDACESMDYMLAEQLIGELGRYSYPEAQESELAAMRTFCSEFEYESLEKMVKAL